MKKIILIFVIVLFSNQIIAQVTTIRETKPYPESLLAIDGNIEIIFSNGLDENTIGQNVKLLNFNSDEIPISVSYSNTILTSPKIVVQPANDLDYSVVYELVLEEGVEDENNQLVDLDSDGVIGGTYRLLIVTEPAEDLDEKIENLTSLAAGTQFEYLDFYLDKKDPWQMISNKEDQFLAEAKVLSETLINNGFESLIDYENLTFYNLVIEDYFYLNGNKYYSAILDETKSKIRIILDADYNVVEDIEVLFKSHYYFLNKNIPLDIENLERIDRIVKRVVYADVLNGWLVNIRDWGIAYLIDPSKSKLVESILKDILFSFPNLFLDEFIWTARYDITDEISLASQQFDQKQVPYSSYEDVAYNYYMNQIIPKKAYALLELIDVQWEENGTLKNQFTDIAVNLASAEMVEKADCSLLIEAALKLAKLSDLMLTENGPIKAYVDKMSDLRNAVEGILSENDEADDMILNLALINLLKDENGELPKDENPGPDLVFNSAEINKTIIEPGNEFRIDYSVCNAGTDTASYFKVRFYLSDDISIGSDINLGSYDLLSGKVPGDCTGELQKYITMPEETYLGVKYVLAFIDADNQVAETEENNNVYAFRITVGSVGVPELIYPMDNAENISIDPSFFWKDLNGADSYDFAIYDYVDGTLQQLYFKGDLTTTTHTPNFNFAYREGYMWTVRAWKDGNRGDWAVLHDFMTERYLEAPDLYFPGNNATNVKLAPHFSWEDLPEADYYYIELGTDPTMENYLKGFNGLTNNSFDFPIDILETSTQYYWTVTGYHNDYGKGETSEIFTFRTGGDVPPGIAYSVAPNNGAENVELGAELTWESGSGVSLWYNIEVSDSLNFDSILFVQDNIENTAYIIPAGVLDPSKEYFWRVRGANNSGYAEYSDKFSFTTTSENSGPGSIIWSTKLGSTIKSIPVFDDEGYIYLNISDDLVKIDPNTGDRIFTLTDACSIENGRGPTISHDGTTIYTIVYPYFLGYPIGDGSKFIVALDKEGNVLWDTNIGFQSSYKPVLDISGNIYIACENGEGSNAQINAIQSYNPSGTLRWQNLEYDDYYKYNEYPVVSGSRLYIQRTGNSSSNISPKLFALNTSNGSTSWSINLNNETDNEPFALTSTGILYTITSDHQLVYKNKTSGGNIWTYTAQDYMQSTSVVDENGTIYNGTNYESDYGEYGAFALAIKSNGSKLWQNEMTDDYRGTCVLDNDGKLYYASSTNVLYCVDKSNGAEEWSMNLNKLVYSLTIGPNGTLYVGTNNAVSDSLTFYAIETNATGLLDSDWPVKGHDYQGTGCYDHNTLAYPEKTLSVSILENEMTTLQNNYLVVRAEVLNQNSEPIPGVNVNASIYNSDNDLVANLTLGFDEDSMYYTGSCFMAEADNYHLNVNVSLNGYTSSKDSTDFLVSYLPPIFLNQKFSISENCNSGDIIDTVNLESSNETFNYSFFIIEGNEINIITMDSATGEIIVNDNLLFDYESNTSFVFKFVVQDDGFLTLTDTAEIVINVMDVYEVDSVSACFITDVISGYIPLAVAFNDQSSGNPKSWLWNFGDGTTSTEQNPVHVYVSVGVYDVSLEVENENSTDFIVKPAFITVEDTVPPEPELYLGWLFEDANLEGYRHYSGTSSETGADSLVLQATSPDIVVDGNSILSGDVNGDGLLEIITVQKNVLYVLSGSGEVLNSAYVGISGIPYVYVTMLADADGDNQLDIGLGYHRGNSNYGNLYARIYDGSCKLLKEFVKNVSADGFMYPRGIIDGDVIITQSTGYGKDPRGYSRWDYETATETWYYDVGPAVGQTSIADADNDGDYEITGTTWNPHNGATGTSGTVTTDGDMWCIVIDEDGNEVFSKKYPAPSDGSNYHKFVDFNGDNTYQILAEENHSSPYTGISQLHIYNATDGSTLHSFDGFGTSNVGWRSSICDMNNDGVNEIVTSNYLSTNSFMQYILDSQLNVLNSAAIKGYVEATGDLTGDGNTEIVLRYQDTIKVLDNNLSLLDFFVCGADVQKAIISNTNSNGINEIIALADKVYILELSGDIPIENCPQHFHAAWEGSFGTDHMNIYVLEAKIEGVDLVEGDEVGVFDGDICVGFGKVKQLINDQAELSIIVSRDDGSGNGYTSGDEISYRLWDCSEQTEYDADQIQCFSDQGIQIDCSSFEVGGTVSVKLGVSSNVCVTSGLEAGWNLFSSPIESDSSDLQWNFQILIDYESLVKIQDERGYALEDRGIYGGWQNDIGDIRPTEGYKVKLSNADSTWICGEFVHYPYPIHLYAGWNIIGYPQIQSFNAMDIIQQLIDNGNLIKVQDEKGNSIEDLGIFGGWQNFLGNFQPSEGYKIKVSEMDTLWIYESYPKSLTMVNVPLPTQHFKTGISGNGVDHMNFNLVELNQEIFSPGDEIAVYDGSTCVGAMVITENQLRTGVLSIPASASDDSGMPGFTEGEKYSIRIWQADQNREMEIEAEHISGPEQFTKHESVILSLEKSVLVGIGDTFETGMAEVTCYPNPFSESVTIEIDIPSQSEVTVHITNQMGQLVQNLLEKAHLPAGSHSLKWIGLNDSNEKVVTGIYFIQTIIDKEVFVNKVVFK